MHLWTSVCMFFAQLFPTVNPMDYSPPGSSVCGILQAGILDWVAIPFSIGHDVYIKILLRNQIRLELVIFTPSSWYCFSMIFHYSAHIIRDQQRAKSLSKYFSYRIRNISFEDNNILNTVAQASFTGIPLLQVNKVKSEIITRQIKPVLACNIESLMVCLSFTHLSITRFLTRGPFKSRSTVVTSLYRRP